MDLEAPLPLEIPDYGRKQLAALFKELGYKIGAEIGVERGEYAEKLLLENPGLKLYGIDPYVSYDQHDDQQRLDNFYKEAEAKLAPYDFTFVKKNSSEAAADFEDGSLDFVYIDGAHDYEHVTEDLNNWSKKVRPGGIVSGHDYISFRSKHYGVVDALKDYTKENNISPWFVLGIDEKVPGMVRDNYRSWMLVKA